MTFLSDPASLCLLAFAVALLGLSKGGLAGIGAMSLPLMALVVSPVQAAGILLPLLLLSDAVSLWQWWGKWNVQVLKVMMPGTLLGVLIGWLLAAQVNDAMVRILVGLISVAFVGRWWWNRRRKTPREAAAQSWAKGSFWGALSGFTSMISHAGAPPYSVYTLPLQMSPVMTTSTSVVYFAIVNTVKILPYFLLGQFGAQNLSLSLMLAPIAILSTFAGAWIIRRLEMEAFYGLIYSLMFLVGLKLLWDGITALLAG